MIVSLNGGGGGVVVNQNPCCLIIADNRMFLLVEFTLFLVYIYVFVCIGECETNRGKGEYSMPNINTNMNTLVLIKTVTRKVHQLRSRKQASILQHTLVIRNSLFQILHKTIMVVFDQNW